MVKEGIIDPTKVVRSALQNAASVATLLLTTDALVADDAEGREEGRPAAAATTTCIESRRFLVVSSQKAGARGPSSAGSCFYRPPLIFARGGSAVGSGKGVTPGIGPGGGTMAGRLDAEKRGGGPYLRGSIKPRSDWRFGSGFRRRIRGS